MRRFEGKTAIVTGAASGIGQEMARQLHDEGATVFAADLSTDGVPPGCTALDVDVCDEQAVARMVAAALDATGKIDLLFNNAGIGSTADVLTCTTEEWDQLFRVNVRGVFFGIRAALPHMLARRSGSIVNTASVAGLVGLRDRAAYCASKGAVVALTRQVALQVADQGVRCNCVCPGTVDSPWVGRLLAKSGDPEKARAALVARQPMGRLGRPVEIAKAALYLASEDAAFVTGEALVIDGGILAG